ncbi:MAG: phosphoglycerate kinase [Actinomycetota bacterium]|nr:phosphoglycerate kinase [Actinomycetota bacterium]MDA3012989.1 phosphoglycerate kinase [Actinomycetota bacterium]
MPLGKSSKLLIRADLNVPIKNGKILDNFRIKKTLSNINHFKKYSKNITFISHLGRPKGKDEDLSLKHLISEMSDIAGQEVHFINDCINLDPKLFEDEAKIFLLENLRFYEGEEQNNLDFAKNLSNPFDTFILDAFGAAHRSHASIVSMGKFLDSYQGPLMQKEVDNLQYLLSETKSPYTVILGGAKISEKLNLVNNLLPKVDNLILGGGMCFTFLKALGLNIGSSLLEENFISTASNLINSKYGKKIILPIDFATTKDISSNLRIEKDIQDFDFDDIGVDIGKKTVERFKQTINISKTIFWNGPMGIFENSNFEFGTKEITKLVSNSDSYTVVGGGDSVSAINKFSTLDKFNHVSTGGGASIEFLEGKILPGVNIYKPLII